MPLTKETHDRRLREVADYYRKRGYDVQVEPESDELPAFLEGFRPDLIVRRNGESLVVEIKVGTATSAIEKFRDLAEKVNDHPGWRLVVQYVPEEGNWEIQAQDTKLAFDEIAARLRHADKLHTDGDSDAALMLLWTAVEAVLRHRVQRDGIPVETFPTSALLKELFSAGELSMEPFNAMEKALHLRNSAVHGIRITGAQETFVQLREVFLSLTEEWYKDSLHKLLEGIGRT